MLNQLLFCALLSTGLPPLPVDLQPVVQAGEQTPKGSVFDDKRKAEVIASVSKSLRESYLFPETGEKIAQEMQSRWERGDYSKIQNPVFFAGAINQLFQELGKDKHLNLFYNEEPRPQEIPVKMRTEEEKKKNRAEAMRFYQSLNYGIRRVERLDGNIGYLNIYMFPPSEFASKAIDAAMVLLEGSDALIIDMRENTGGSPSTVAYLISYFLDKRTHLADNYDRKANTNTQTWSVDQLPSPRYDIKKPIYILTSHETFSGGEDFTYTMQALKRAQVVGETTGGGAHATNVSRVDENFEISIPYLRSTNPITKTNWEGTGIQPDIVIESHKALNKVRIDFLKRKLKTSLSPREKSEIVESILKLNSNLSKQD